MAKGNTKKKKTIAHLAEEVGGSLNERQKLFAILYTTDKNCFGNATSAYKKAYNLTDAQYKSANVNSHRLIVNDSVQAFIKKFLEERFNEECVDKELAKVINQDKDLHAKNSAIQEFNKLQARILTKVDVTSNGKTIHQIVGMKIIKDDDKKAKKS